MEHGVVVGICIAALPGAPMQPLQEVLAIAGRGLRGDRYASGEGSFNKGNMGGRQVTLFNAHFLFGSGFEFPDTRRNIAVNCFELMDHIGHEFTIGDALFRGVKYCDPCTRPSKLCENSRNFRAVFHDRGGLVAEVVRSGIIRLESTIIPRKKNY